MRANQFWRLATNGFFGPPLAVATGRLATTLTAMGNDETMENIG